MSQVTDLIAALEEKVEPAKIEDVARFFKGGDAETRIMGVPMPKVFPVAKQFTDLGLVDVETLLDDARYEVRMAAVSVMDFQARRKRLSDAHRKALFDLYLRRHDRINNWDLVDRAAPHVVGTYLVDKDRSILKALARSNDPHERRTAIVSTFAFIRRGEVEDTFRIADMLAGDGDDYVQKAVASWTREAGKRDAEALIAFLERNKKHLPRSTITAASKLLPDSVRKALRS
ncbi:DNA alkylation repair protein [uncultured Tateyamaria sp.]|uniref:DNA alkylation repair protein n=1 Tax=uncultured Tateyamaria sp. TaxID=455651 RepID=UPI0026074E09|nr:DNA alkylation repair protein [uncultured Tateyamaria sp.]